MAIGLSIAIEAIWKKHEDEIAGRIATLEEAVAATLAGEVKDDLRERAQSDAHKLAGSLGMFGFPTGSELARELEQALGAGIQPVGRDRSSLVEIVLALRREFETRAAPSTPAEGRRLDGATRKILVIDDSALIRRVVKIGLGEDRGWRVCVAESGAKGIELATRERPDAILLDVEMPDLDGPATLARLRAGEATRDVPVLFLTGHAADQDRRELVALGAAGVIAKPFDPAGLADEVAWLLR